MNVLLIGGTGLISSGIVTHLLKRKARVTMFNRGQRDSRLAGPVECITGDRNKPEELAACVEGRTWDVVIDMICFKPEQADLSIRTFAGKCKQFIFCSTVCTYGIKIPAGVVIDETFPQAPVGDYGTNKVACEQAFLRAGERGDFAATIIRPSHTYGEGAPLIDQLEFNACSWDRIERGLPVIVAGDGMQLWNSTHRDDVGSLFAHACMNERTFGESYNATTQRIFTWRDYYREAAAALGKKAQLVSMPAEWIIRHDPQRFGLLWGITRYHGPYTSAKAKRDIPGFEITIDFQTGAKRTLDDLKARGVWRDGAADAIYQQMIDRAIAAGSEPFEA